ncbi:hypothetical protein [Hyphomicrobium sp. MC8b]|uniref:hypothetical protein n=1 Tax=unclassified Hyphomicrobium TaxID=2619925 RepID=UPI0004AE6D4E
MRVGAHFFGLACIAVAAVGFGSRESSSEMLNRAGFVHTGFTYNQAKPASAAAAQRRRLLRPSAEVASATRQLDLSKLTLADFGDVER